MKITSINVNLYICWKTKNNNKIKDNNNKASPSPKIYSNFVNDLPGEPISSINHFFVQFWLTLFFLIHDPSLDNIFQASKNISTV